MNNYTFGNYESAKILCGILDKVDKKTKKFINQLVQHYIFELNELDNIKNYSIKITWLQRIRKHHIEKLKNKKLLKEKKEVIVFTTEVIVTWYRIKLRKYNKEK